jgi:hypothetical protein
LQVTHYQRRVELGHSGRTHDSLNEHHDCLFSEAQQVLKDGFEFPALAIPFGADYTTPCRYLGSADELTKEDISFLLENSWPMPDKIRRIHLIARQKSGISFFNPGSIFYLIES